MDLDDPNLKWHTLEQSPDPMGRVFEKAGKFYRAVYSEQVPHVQELLRRGILRKLAKRNLIPRQSPIEISHPRYGMILRSESARSRVLFTNFPIEALRDATLAWVDINRVLAREGYALIDGHYGNFALFGNSVPKWVDMGSIQPMKSRHRLQARFEKIVYPLVIFGHVPELIARRDQFIIARGGVHKDVAKEILDRHGARFPKAHNELLWNSKFMTRETVLAGLRKLLADLVFEIPDAKWSKYRKSGLEGVLDKQKHIYEHRDPRDRTVLELVKRINPRGIIDMGANKGYHSVMFANEGYDVIAVDPDEFSVNVCYTWLKAHPELRVCCSVDEFSKAKLRADTVVSLALTHHLTLTQKLSFDQVADRYAQLAQRHLVVEFMPNGMGGTVPRPNPLPEWYTVENFKTSLSRYFTHVRTVKWESRRGPEIGSRTLIHCSHPRP